jgi:hypothetical protein
VPALLGQDAPRKTKFQSLHHDGRILLLRFADQQMNVFGHDHVANDDEGIALADLLQHSQKQVPTARSAEQGLSTITTASDEVKVSSAVVAMQIVPHGHSIAPPRPRGGDVGHPPTVMKTQGRAIQREATSQKPREVAHPQFVLCDGSTTNSFLSQDRCGPPADRPNIKVAEPALPDAILSDTVRRLVPMIMIFHVSQNRANIPSGERRSFSYAPHIRHIRQH